MTPKLVIAMAGPVELHDSIAELTSVFCETEIFHKNSNPEFFIEALSEATYAILDGKIFDMEVYIRAIEQNSTLKMIQCPWAGIQPFVSILENRKDIILCNNHSNSLHVSQHAISMLFSLLYGTVLPFPVLPFHKTLNSLNLRIGMMGTGSIASKILQFLAPFPFEFIGLRRTKQNDDFYSEMYDFTEIDMFMSKCDILMVSLPKTELTEGMLNRDRLEAFTINSRLGGVIVSVGRSAVFKEKDLFDMLKEKKLKAFSSDVWWRETNLKEFDDGKYPFNEPFHLLDNVLFSPHRADSPTFDLSLFKPIIDNIEAFMKGDEYIWKVNLEHGY
eukprot:TRINITY_DN3155_c1_g1_i1.p1 TRINITY_DN3155_c1_g1~~TRINITY_DN3155_c1_g1_i1.p1  ORF type:complete len:331 (-),score=82.85 TRINITY_DN3155_c1_g1_i1:5-997(-)